MPPSHDSLDAFSDVLAALYAKPSPARAAAELARPLQELFAGSQVEVVWTPDPPALGTVEPAFCSDLGVSADAGVIRLVLAARLEGGGLAIRLAPWRGSGEEAVAWLEQLRPHVAAAFAGVRFPGEPLPESDRDSCWVIRLGADGRAGDALPDALARGDRTPFPPGAKGSRQHGIGAARRARSVGPRAHPVRVGSRFARA